MPKEKSNGRKIHIALPEDVHQRLRIKCAMEDVSMQQFVADLLALTVADIKVKSNNRQKASS